MSQIREVLTVNAAPLYMDMGDGTARIMHTVSGGTKVFIWGESEGGGSR